MVHASSGWLPSACRALCALCNAAHTDVHPHIASNKAAPRDAHISAEAHAPGGVHHASMTKAQATFHHVFRMFLIHTQR